MSHFTEGALQAYLDEEVGADARAQFHAHMSECADCAARLQLLRESNTSFGQAVSLLDVAIAPAVELSTLRVRAQQEEWRERLRGASRRWSRAAILVIGMSAVAAATVPGSPLRNWLLETWKSISTKDVEVSAPPAVQAPEAPVESPTPLNVTPVSGRVRIGLQRAAAGTSVHVALIDAEKATIETAATRFRSGAGWLEATGVTGEVRIALPRGLASATVEVDGRVYVVKEGDYLRYIGPSAAARSDSELTFKPSR